MHEVDISRMRQLAGLPPLEKKMAISDSIDSDPREPGYREPSKDPKDLKIQELQEVISWHEENEKKLDGNIDELRVELRHYRSGDNRDALRFSVVGLTVLCCFISLFVWLYFNSTTNIVDNAAVCENVCSAMGMEVGHCRDFRVTCVGDNHVQTFAH